MTRWLTLGVVLLSGCAVVAPEKVYWQKFYGHDEFYKWVCQYDPQKKILSFEGPTITYAERFDAQCFRTLDLKERHR